MPRLVSTTFRGSPAGLLSPALLLHTRSVLKRQSPTTTFSFSALNGMSNATFAASLCSSLDSYEQAGTPLAVINIYGGTGLPCVVPDCLWTTFGLYASTLKTVTFFNMIVTGNSSGSSAETGPSSSDPLMRLSSNISSITIHTSILVDPTTATYTPNWQAFVERVTLLTNLQLTDSPLGGAMFPTIPALLNVVSISNCGLTGSISEGLLSLLSAGSRSAMLLNLPSNKLSGSIPENLFSNFADGSSFARGGVDLSDNMLTGTIPAALLSTENLPSATFSFYLRNNSLTGSLPASVCARCPRTLLLDFGMNQLSGTISPSLLDDWVAKNPLVLQFHASNNAFTGAVPNFFSNVSPMPIEKRAASVAMSSVRLDFSSNKFTSAGLNVVANATIFVQGGQDINLAFNEISSLPAHFLDSASPLTIDLTANKLTSLPAAFLHGIDTDSGSYSASILLGQNLLTSLPEDIFTSELYFSGLSFNVSYNPTLTGSLPSSLTSLAASSTPSFELDFSHCGFTGAIPNMRFTNRVDGAIFHFGSNHLSNGSAGLSLSSFIDADNTDGITGLRLDVSNNAFVGVLDVTGLPSSAQPLMADNGFYLNASGNSFTAFAFDDSWAIVTYSLDISRNTLMTVANFPESLFNASSVISFLYASNTGITGVFPRLHEDDFMYLSELDFSGSSGIDFCSGNRTAWTTTSLSVCKLYLTSAAECSDLYPTNCEFLAPPEADPIASPVEAPIGSPSAAPGTPVATSAPSTPETPSATPVAPIAPVAPGTPTAITPTRPPTGDASTTSASLIAIVFAAFLALVASV